MTAGQNPNIRPGHRRPDPVPQLRYIPEAIQQVVRKNLEIILGDKEGQVQDLLNAESMSGNSGKWRGLNCITANFYFDVYLGEIKYCGNFGEAPQDITNRFHHHRFIFAWNREEEKVRIVRYSNPKNASAVAQITLAETARQYNEKYGF